MNILEIIKNMFDVYEEEGLTEEQIGDLLEYCDKKFI
jgi:hypothetical protein